MINFKHSIKYDKKSNIIILSLRQKYKKITKKALLSYLPEPVNRYLSGEKTVRFSNEGIAISWAKSLVKIGYEVDIISWDDLNFKVNKDYDLFVCHGGVNFDNLYNQFNKKPKIIYFATGNYWKFHNKQELSRINSFNKKYNTTYAPDRMIEFSEEKPNKIANGIIVLGNKNSKLGFPNAKVLNINNASYPDRHFYLFNRNKDYNLCKKNFMFFAGAGNVHKGLDLLLESFVGSENNLYVVGHLEPKFCNIMNSFFEQENIHKIGEVSMRSKEFYNISDKCVFAVLPSCSEGQAGSIVECMNQGLIPIVSKETRLDVGNFGFLLNNTHPKEIRRICTKASRIESTILKKMSSIARQEALKNHSVKYFEKKLINNIRVILNG